MSTYTLTGGDIATLNEAADLAMTAAKSAKREATKAFLDQAATMAQALEGYAEESKTFLANVEHGKVQLAKGHLDALSTGMRLLYADVKKKRGAACELFVNPEGFDVRLQEIRDTLSRLRLSVQLELDDEADADRATREPELAGV